MIRVLHCLARVYSGGVERRRMLLAEHLPASEFEHHVICQSAAGGLPDRLRERGWSIETIGDARHVLDPAWHRRAIAAARRFGPDLVHGAVYEGEALAFSTGLALFRTPVVMEETSDPANRRWTGNLLMRGMLARADVVVAVSPAVGRYLADSLRVSSDKVRIIDNAVAAHPAPAEADLEQLKRDLSIDDRDFVVGTVGRLVDSHKRVSDLIRALEILRSDERNIKLLVVGDGPDRPALQELAVELGVHDACVWAGYQSAPEPYYHVMDVFVLASAREAFGLVLVEAMQAGRPVIGTSVGGIPHVLDDGKAGLLVPPQSPRALAEAIGQLYVDRNEADRLANAGRHRAATMFAAERYAADIRELYRSLTSAGSSARVHD